MYATDDRYTDDVHYCGGVLRALDLIDYPLYMVAMNALPPVPAVWGDGADGDWADEWARRVEHSPPWMMTWLRSPTDDAQWRRGSIRLGPDGDGYERIGCPTMLIAGLGRRLPQQHVPNHRAAARCRGVCSPARGVTRIRPTPGRAPTSTAIARSSPSSISTSRGGPPSSAHHGQIFVRRPTPPQPDLALHEGDVARGRRRGRPPSCAPSSIASMSTMRRSTESAVDELAVQGDVGMYAWNSCAGGLPWGQPLDQRIDNARSLTYDWHHAAETDAAGSGTVTMRVRSSADVGHVSVKLCDVAPDGTSTLITRGMLDLTHVGCWPADPTRPGRTAPAPLVPGEWIDVTIELEATTWTLVPGHRTAPGDRRHRLAQLLATEVTVRAGGRPRIARGWRCPWPTRCRRRPTSSARPEGRATTMPTVSSGDTSTTCWRARAACTAGTADGTTASTARSSTTATRGRWASAPPTCRAAGRVVRSRFDLTFALATGPTVVLDRGATGHALGPRGVPRDDHPARRARRPTGRRTHLVETLPR